MNEWVLPDNAKFHEKAMKKFKEYEAEMEKLQTQDCSYYRKKTNKCGKGTINLFPYQRVVRKFINDQTPFRGLLVYHKVGAGKTFTGVSVAEFMNRNVIIMCPAALKRTWVEHIVKYSCDKHHITWDDWNNALKDRKLMKQIIRKINQKYTFVSLDAPNSREILKRQMPLDNKLIIIDECHNLAHQIISPNSKNGGPIYDMLMNTNNVKILCMSATPLVGDPYELAITFNILRGYINVDKTKYELFPSDYKEFIKYFVDYHNNRIINKNVFQERINGLVSYYRGITDPRNLIFPTLIGPKIVNIEMSGKQWSIYARFREKELDEERIISHAKQEFKAAAHKKPSRQTSTTYRTKSRRACNFVLPTKDKDGQQLEYPHKKLDTFGWDQLLKRIPDYALKANEKLAEYSPKLDWILKDIKNKTKGIIMIYSDFITFGVDITKLIFKANGFTEYNGKGDLNKGKDYFRYAVVSGRVEQDRRSEIMNIINKPENKHGKGIRVFIVSSVIAEGLSLRNLRYMYILEPYWQDIRIEQVIGRGTRICSHYDLPPKERTLEVFILLANAPKGTDPKKALGERKSLTTDQFIYEHARKRRLLLDQYLLAIQEVAIDCETFKKHNKNKDDPFPLKNCVHCKNPDSTEPVYYPNFNKHIKPGYSSCIPHQIDYLEGPEIHNNKLFVYDPFNNNAYLVCKMSYLGKYCTADNIIDKTGSGDVLRDLSLLKKIIIRDNKFIIYNAKNFNAYSIDRLIPIGHWDPDMAKYRIIKDYALKECSYVSNNKKKGGKNRRSRRSKKY